MSIKYEDLELLATLETDNITSALDSTRPVDFPDACQDTLIGIAKESFLNGVEWGIDVDAVTTIPEMTMEIVSRYENTLASVAASFIRSGVFVTVEEILVLRSRYFMNGVMWCLSYRSTNDLI